MCSLCHTSSHSVYFLWLAAELVTSLYLPLICVNKGESSSTKSLSLNCSSSLPTSLQSAYSSSSYLRLLETCSSWLFTVFFWCLCFWTHKGNQDSIYHPTLFISQLFYTLTKINVLLPFLSASQSWERVTTWKTLQWPKQECDQTTSFPCYWVIVIKLNDTKLA